MAYVALRSPSEKVGGLFYFGRMLDKIRLRAEGELPSAYHANLGTGFDEKCVKFLAVDYAELVDRVKQGGTDHEILDWCFAVGANQLKTTFTFGTNSCGSAAGTTTFRKWWYAAKPRQE